MKKIFLVSLLTILPILAFANDQFPSFPMGFWGEATIDEQPLDAGTKIQAYCETDLIGEITMIEDGVYGYEDSTKIKLLVSGCDEDIIFKYLLVGASMALKGEEVITETFVSGKTENKNLEFKTVSLTSPPPGRGGGLSPREPEIEKVKGDITGDGKVGILDFNILMVNWGKVEADNIADLNNDGRVDILDFNILMINWTK